MQRVHTVYTIYTKTIYLKDFLNNELFISHIRIKTEISGSVNPAKLPCEHIKRDYTYTQKIHCPCQRLSNPLTYTSHNARHKSVRFIKISKSNFRLDCFALSFCVCVCLPDRIPCRMSSFPLRSTHFVLSQRNQSLNHCGILQTMTSRR